MEYSLKTPLLSTSEPIREKEIQGIRGSSFNQDLKTINCASCHLKLAYSDGVYCIKCPECQGITAVQNLSTMNCARCNGKMIFPENSPTVICQCGQAYAVNNQARTNY